VADWNSIPSGSRRPTLLEGDVGLVNRVAYDLKLPLSNFGPVTVPAGSYFMLGDNRDDSADSRCIGFVPRRMLIGRAHHVLVSADILDDWLPRLPRFGHRLE